MTEDYSYCPSCGVVGADKLEICPQCQRQTLPFRPDPEAEDE